MSRRAEALRLLLGMATSSSIAFGASADASTERVPEGALVRGSFDAELGRVDVTAVAYPLARVTLRVVMAAGAGEARSALARFASDRRVLAAINGGYFLSSGAPDGLLVRDGRERSPAFPGLSGVVGSLRDGTPFLTTTRGYTGAHVRDAEQSGPFLIDPGGTNGIHGSDGYPANRSVVLLGSGRIALVFTTVCDLPALSAAMLARPRLFGVERVERALNLDGGPSSTLAVRRADDSQLLLPESGPLATLLTLERRQGLRANP